MSPRDEHRGSGAAPEPADKYLVRGLLIAGSALCMLVFAVGGSSIEHQRRQALSNASRELSNLCLALSSAIENNFRSIDLLGSALVERLDGQKIPSLVSFDQLLATRLFYEDLRARTAALPQVEAIFVADANGKTITSSRAFPFPDAWVADRAYFRELRDNPAQTSFLGEPSRNQITGTWNIYLSRRVTAADGSFLGAVVVALDLSYLESFLGSVNLGSAGSVGLLRHDGILLARYPHVEGAAGRSQAGSAVYIQLLASAGAASLQAKSNVDGVERLIAVRSLARYPVIALVSRSVADILIGWRHQAVYMASGTALLVGIIVVMMTIGVRQVRNRGLLGAANVQLALAEEREAAEQDRRIQHARLEAALNGMSQGLCMFDADDHVVVSNGRFTSLLGVSQATAQPGVSQGDLIGVAVRDGILPAECATELRSPSASGGVTPSSVLRIMRDGRSLSIGRSLVADDGWLVTLEDVSEQRNAEARIAHLAHHDPLTGLPNRALFRIHLNDAVTRAKRAHTAALLYLDLDHFKEVNDTYGHAVGDALLKAVAERLSRELRDVDSVARLGGDEFAIVQSDPAKPEDTVQLAGRLVATLAVPFDLHGVFVAVGTSIGVSTLPGDGLDADELLKRADVALYRAKEDGRGCYRFFENDMDVRMQLRRTLDLELRRAIEHGEFELFYQPIVSIQTNKVSSFEALLRWRHPERGLMTPDRFIPLAEESGLIIPIGGWVLEQACAEAMSWPENIRIAVNLSPTQFASGGLAESVAATLTKSGLNPARLEVEITETVMLKDTEATLATLHRLRSLGIGIVLDDFGTGYSSLGYLQRFPFDRVKIDRSFVRHLDQRRESVAIVRAIADLCASLQMATIAEGVETEEQYRCIATTACTAAQGFLFGTPRPAGEVAALIASLGGETQRVSPRKDGLRVDET